jgi:hypothetical protein
MLQKNKNVLLIYVIFTSTWDPLSTQIVQGHVWKEEYWHFVGESYEYIIDLKEGVQPPFGSIYSLWQNELA